MFSEGKVKSYHQDRGFGFIEIENDDRDLFFHIKDFPNRQVEPQIGESLKFRIAEEFGKNKIEMPNKILDEDFEKKIKELEESKLPKQSSENWSNSEKKDL